MEDGLGLLGRKFLRIRAKNAVVGRRRAHRFEVGPAIFQGLNKGRVNVDMAATNLAERLDLRAPLRRIDIEQGVRPEGGPHLSGPS